MFLALALTVFLGAIGRGDEAGDPGTGLAFSLALSAASAGLGGHFRAKRREDRPDRR